MMNKKILLGTVVALATLVTSKGKNRKTRWKSAGFKLGKRRERLQNHLSVARLYLIENQHDTYISYVESNIISNKYLSFVLQK